MPRDPRYDVLFEPVQIGPKTMRNRFYQTPYTSGFGVDYPRGQASFRGIRAEGGWAVVNTEICSIHPESDIRPWVDSRLWDDNDARNLEYLCGEIHRHQSLAGIQLFYGGATGPNMWTRASARGVSQLPSDTSWEHSPYAMDKAEIRELQSFYVHAAKRAQDVGFDIVNVCANGYVAITQQFLLSYYNHRTDEYGGSFANRARFVRELLEMLNEAVGDACAITMRLNIDSRAEGERGFRVEHEGVELVGMCDHLVDFWDLDIGGEADTGDCSQWGADAAPARFYEEGWQRPWIEKIRPATDKPIVGVGRFTNPDTMAGAVASGLLDIIGGARPGLSDPFLPQKIEEGRVEDIRECIGCNICVSRYFHGVPVNCTQNATAGEEYRRGWHPEKVTPAANRDRSVLVVGAGPAGMECAIMLGKRGMSHVHLVDAEREPGGILRWLPSLPGLATWRRMVDYRQVQLDKLRNVDFIPRKLLTTDAILDYGADIVILATGARWATDGMSAATYEAVDGADARQANCFTPEQILVEGKDMPGDDVVIYDCDGYFMGVGLAERLAAEGRRVRIVTPMAGVARTMFTTDEGYDVYRRLTQLGVELAPSHKLSSVTDGHVTARPALAPAGTSVQWSADAVVLVTRRESQNNLYRELQERSAERTEAGITAVYRIGDCVAPKLIADCVFDGHRLGREIDSDNPARPLPFLREQVVIGS